MDTVENWESLSEPVAWRPTEEYLRKSRLLRFMRPPRYSRLRHSARTRRQRSRLVLGCRLKGSGAGLAAALHPGDGHLHGASPGPPGLSGANSTTSQPRSTSTPAAPAPIRPPSSGKAKMARSASSPTASCSTLTNRVANALAELGVGRGDRVAIYMPMIPETVAATLACGKIGAIYMPVFSGYGAEAVATRLQDSEAKVLITADGYYRRGKVVAMKETADAAAAASPSVRASPRRAPDGERGALDRRARRLVARGRPEAAGHLPDAGHRSRRPYMLIYTSGTTGKPKGAVHVHCGFPIKGAQDMAHLFDVQADDTLFWLTDIGWMMGPWAISGTLMLGATLALYEGTPDYPSARPPLGLLPSATASPSWASRLPSSAR